MKRILVLYRELAGYFVNCLNHLCDQNNVEADVVAYPVHSDAPFQFEFSSRIRCHDRNQVDLQKLESLHVEHQYDMVFCGGWSDKMYMQWVSHHQEVPALLGFDNQWQGNLRQWLAVAYARARIVKQFHMAFVPGIEQAAYAQRMGFRKIVQGAYCCDVAKFTTINTDRSKDHWQAEMKTLFYVGRYAREKFIVELQEAFAQIIDRYKLPWRLVCAGTGPLWEDRSQHPSIEHLGFLQPAELLHQMQSGHAFVLPSTFEPWGVVVHEFAAAGYPMILSNRVGARTAFLKPAINGFEFISGDKHDLSKVLLQLMQSSGDQLFEMSQQSYYLAQSITPASWSKGVLTLLEP
jgi:glycosyltransferase involved in cell wall biosynthesis